MIHTANYKCLRKGCAHTVEIELRELHSGICGECADLLMAGKMGLVQEWRPSSEKPKEGQSIQCISASDNQVFALVWYSDHPITPIRWWKPLDAPPPKQDEFEEWFKSQIPENRNQWIPSDEKKYMKIGWDARGEWDKDQHD